MRVFILLVLFLISVPAAVRSEPTTPIDFHVASFGENSEKMMRVCREVADFQYGQTLAKQPVETIEILEVIGPDSYLVFVGEKMYQMSFGEAAAHQVGMVLKRRFRATANLNQNEVPIGIVPPRARKMTPQEIILELKRGETFTIEKGTTKRRCVACGGFGFKSSIDKIKCPECNGVGIFNDPRFIRVIW